MSNLSHAVHRSNGAAARGGTHKVSWLIYLICYPFHHEAVCRVSLSGAAHGHPCVLLLCLHVSWQLHTSSWLCKVGLEFV